MADSLPWMTWLDVVDDRLEEVGERGHGPLRHRPLSGHAEPPDHAPWKPRVVLAAVRPALRDGRRRRRRVAGSVGRGASAGRCWRSTSAAPSWRPALVDDDGRVGLAGRCRRRPTTDAEAAVRRPGRPGRRARPAPAPSVCGVGCGGPMTAGGEHVSPLNIPAWRDFPLRARLAELTGLPTFVDNDAKALALGEGWRGAAARRAPTTSPWWCRPASAAASCSTAACSTGRRQRRPHRPRDRRARRPPVRAAGPAAASRRRRRAPPSPPSPAGPAAEAGPEVVARTGRLVGPGGGVGRQPARPAAGRRRRLGRPRLRRAVLRRRPGRGRRAAPGSTSRPGTRIVPAGLGADGPLVGRGRRRLARAGLATGGVRRRPAAGSSLAGMDVALSARGRGLPREGPGLPGRAPAAGWQGIGALDGDGDVALRRRSGAGRCTSTTTWP